MKTGLIVCSILAFATGWALGSTLPLGFALLVGAPVGGLLGALGRWYDESGK